MQTASREYIVIALLVIAAIAVSGFLGFYLSALAGSSGGTNQSQTSVSSTQTSSGSQTKTSFTETSASYPDSYYWSMPMMNAIPNSTWMYYPSQTIGISQAVLLMRNPPSYVTSIKGNDTVQFRSNNITVLIFGMMPSDAANLTGTSPPSYASDDVFVVYGLINPTMVMPAGASVHFIFVNLDNDMYHNFVLTTDQPPYSNSPMQGMMGGGMMGGGYGNGLYGGYMMPYVNPANYAQGMAYASSYGLTLGGQTTLWYICSYPDHAESGMYGKVLITGEEATTSSVGNATDSFTVYVSHLGFNGTSGKLNLLVDQGDAVSIKFVWNDSSLGFNNAHQMEVQGYGVVSAVISQKSQLSVIQFTADKAGSFQINCIIPCDGMDNLQNGWLVVNSA